MEAALAADKDPWLKRSARRLCRSLRHRSWHGDWPGGSPPQRLGWRAGGGQSARWRLTEGMEAWRWRFADVGLCRLVQTFHFITCNKHRWYNNVLRVLAVLGRPTASVLLPCSFGGGGRDATSFGSSGGGCRIRVGRMASRLRLHSHTSVWRYLMATSI